MAEEDILINVLLDRSGSMAHLQTDVIGHYNEFIRSQAKLPGNARVSLVIFDTEYKEVYLDRPINEVPELTNETYFARGGTAYLDAIGRLIRSVDAIKDKPRKVMFVINTDGEENSSKEFKLPDIKDTITERTNNHDWQFVFVGAGIDATAAGTSLGVSQWNTFAVASSPQGMTNTLSTVNLATSNYRSGATAGVNLRKAAADLGIEEETKDTPQDTYKKKKKAKTPSQ